MSGDNKHIIYTAADIERYHAGKMNAAERHALEKAALDDPFLADALEGFPVTSDFSADMQDLDNRLQQRIGGAKLVKLETAKRERFRWMRVAAALIVLAGGAILANQLLFNKKENDIARNDQPARDTAGKETAEVSDTSKTYPFVLDDENPPSGGQTSPVNTREETTTRTGLVQPRSSFPDSSPVTRDVLSNAGTVSPAEMGIKDDKTVVTANAEKAAQNYVNKSKESEGYVSKAPAGEELQRIDLAKKSQSQRKNEMYATKMNTFRGRVIDENNRGLPFANVMNTRDNVGTYTDVSGNFVLTSTDSVLNVQVRSLGYDINTKQLSTSLPDNTVVMEDNQDGITETIVSRSNSNAMRRQVGYDAFKVDEPEPADGWENYDVYLANNLNVPDDYTPPPSAPREVELSFEVNKNGEPVNFRVERSLCRSCDQEAIRLIKDGPKWKRNARKRTRVTVAF